MNTHVTYDSTRYHNYVSNKHQSHLQNLCDFYSEGVNIHNYHKLDDRTCKSLANACQIHSCSAAIDIVILWIDLEDKNMQLLYDSVYRSIQNSTLYSYSSITPNRFRDIKQLTYLLRSIDQNDIRWARRIFLVTNNQTPGYINISHPRIRVVTHDQLLNYTNVPPPKYPLFNSIAIQSMIHNIPTLSSPFYLFDDDIVIKKNLSLSMILNGNKTIVDLDKTMYDINVNPRSIYEAHIHSTIQMVLGKKTLDLLREDDNYAIPFHGPILLYREIGKKIWNEFRQEMNLLLSHPFRMSTDPSIQTLYIYTGYSDYYTFVKDRGILYFDMLELSDVRIIQKQLKEAFINQDVYFICINDNLLYFDNEIQKSITDSYELIFPKVCSFENKS